MSVIIYFASFNSQKADQKWANFDNSVKETDTQRKIKELENKLYSDDLNINYALSEQEIYNPKLRGQADKKRADIAWKKQEIEQQLENLKKESSQSFTPYYIKEQKPIEREIIIQEMIDLDINFGGKVASFSSAVDEISSLERTLEILFPELKLPEDVRDYTKDKWIKIVKSLNNDLENRFIQSENDLMRSEDLGLEDKNDLEALKIHVITGMLNRISPVMNEVSEGAEFITWTDYEGYPDSEQLKERAKRHIEMLKDHPLMKIPLQNYRDSE